MRLTTAVLALATGLVACDVSELAAPRAPTPSYSDTPQFASEDEAYAYIASQPAPFVSSYARASAGGSHASATTVVGIPWPAKITNSIFVGWHMGGVAGTIPGSPNSSIGASHTTVVSVPQVSCNTSTHGWLSEQATHTVAYYIAIYIPKLGPQPIPISTDPQVTSGDDECPIPEPPSGGDGSGGGGGGGGGGITCAEGYVYDPFAGGCVPASGGGGGGGSGGSGGGGGGGGGIIITYCRDYIEGGAWVVECWQETIYL